MEENINSGKSKSLVKSTDEKKENYFKKLNDVDVSDKVKAKNGLNYLPWSCAWGEVKKIYPDANFNVYEQSIPLNFDERHDMFLTYKRPWFTDGKTGWVKVGVTINKLELVETLAIMDHRNKPIPADDITSVDANKSIKRCLAKACALHGLGLYVYDGEELPETVLKKNQLKESVLELIKKKSALSDKAKDEVASVCLDIAAEENGDPRLVEDEEKLKEMKKKLLAIRK